MVDVQDIAPDAMSKGEASGKDHVWRILGYGNPGTAKTHFGFSMSEVESFGPVFCIDTEGKAHSITEKFDGEIFVWEVSNYDEAEEALSQALDAAHAYRDEQGVLGTIMVDSMSHMWDWSQQKYMELAYPDREPNEVNLNSALNDDGQGDWQSIKRLHNDRFRKKMLESPYHLYWTATSREDYGAILNGQDDPPAKPEGEKNNLYKATEMVHFYGGDEGVPTANLKKTALTKWKFGNLKWPTFQKARSMVEWLVQAETDPEPVTISDFKNQFSSDVSLFDGDPDIAMQGE